MPAPFLGDAAGTGNGACVGAVDGLVEDHRTAVGDRSLDASGIAFERAGGDGVVAGVGVDAREQQFAGAGLNDAAGAGDDAEYR